MKKLAIFLSFMALGLTIVPSVLVLAGEMDIETNKNLMIAGMLLWFVMAPLWINQGRSRSN